MGVGVLNEVYSWPYSHILRESRFCLPKLGGTLREGPVRSLTLPTSPNGTKLDSLRNRPELRHSASGRSLWDYDLLSPKTPKPGHRTERCVLHLFLETPLRARFGITPLAPSSVNSGWLAGSVDLCSDMRGLRI